MATPLSADKMLAALKKEGVKVVERSGWRTHNRNHKGAWGPVNGIIIHHTAGADSSAGLSLVYNGRSDLPGPLAHAYLSKAGTVTLTGNGRSNHAGLGDDDVLKAVVAENYGDAPPRPNENNTDGNAHFYGIEIANLGNGKDPYPKAQYDAAVKWAAAICRAHGWSAKSVIGHKEWTNQKIDPRGPVGSASGKDFSMVQFRKDVQARLTPAKPPKTEEKTTVTELPLSNPTDFGGPFQMDLSRSVALTLNPEGWTDIPFLTETLDEDNQFTIGDYRINGNCTYSGVLYVNIGSVPAGDEIQVRMVERSNSTNSVLKTHPIAEGLGSDGSTFLAFSFNGLLPVGRNLGFQIANYTPATVFLNTAQLKLQTWVRSV
jgi:hypothetical protein